MNRIEILCKIALKIGLDLDKNSFNNRKILQKSIYLLQEKFELDLGYKFVWYLFGPYSKELALDGLRLYDNWENISLAIKDEELSENAEQKIQEFMDLVGNKLKDAVWLETVACMHYISINILEGNKNYEEIKRKIFEMKKEIIDDISSTGQEVESYLEEIWKKLFPQ